MTAPLPFAGIGELLPSSAESTAFGFTVARLSVGGDCEREVAERRAVAERVARAVLGAPQHTVILRFPSELVELARWEWPADRRGQHAGTLVYWEDESLEEPPIPSGLVSTVVRNGEHPSSAFVTDSLAVFLDSFRNYVNHYSYNREIPSDIARDGYADWARRTIADEAGAAVLLREPNGEAIAAATVRLHHDGGGAVAEVELASVSHARQGSGRYRDLWSTIREVARRSGAERLIISTQASNVRVQRAWARLGLVPLASFDTHHVSRRSPTPQGAID